MNKRIVFCASLTVAFLLVPGTSHARWLKVETGRFMTMDTFEGDQQDPKSLHKYAYCEGDPVNNVDPSGNDISGTEGLSVLNIVGPFFAQISPVASQVQSRAQQVTIGTRLSSKTFWAAYLKVNYDTFPPEQNKKVWEFIGGNLGKDYGERHPVADSCSTRLSYGLNYGGAPIPSTAPGANRNFSSATYNHVKGDDKYYIISAANMQSHLKNIWGSPDYPQVPTMPAINTIVSSLQAQQVAIFATKGEYGFGHSGALKQGYHDPYIAIELPVDVWTLNVP